MALLTNDFTTYSNVGIREDLSDTIYRVAPEETPFINAIGSGKSTATFHEWQIESLASVNTANAQLEGDTITADAANVPTRVGNRCQIARKTASVSGTNDAVNKAGRDTEMARQVMLKGMELARDQESGNADNEQRVRQLEEKLRCLVCQNQSLADSNAELAGDLRKQVREQDAAGRSDEQILEFLVQRYGDFVRYEPPFKATTALLWIGPFALLAAAATFLLLALRRRRDAPEEPALGADDKRVIERVLGPDEKSRPADGEAR